jgi:hypothetical protein
LDIGDERVTGRGAADFDGRAGALAFAQCNTERVLLFDARTGVRIEEE